MSDTCAKCIDSTRMLRLAKSPKQSLIQFGWKKHRRSRHRELLRQLQHDVRDVVPGPRVGTPGGFGVPIHVERKADGAGSDCSASRCQYGRESLAEGMAGRRARQIYRFVLVEVNVQQSRFPSLRRVVRCFRRS